MLYLELFLLESQVLQKGKLVNYFYAFFHFVWRKLTPSCISYFIWFGVSRMTLLLGPPSSGKTTLLLALAGKLDRDLRVCSHFC